jgi:hypothetical protein
MELTGIVSGDMRFARVAELKTAIGVPFSGFFWLKDAVEKRARLTQSAAAELKFFIAR